MYVVLRLWTIGNSACAAFGNGIRADLDQAASFMHVVRYRPEPAAGLVSSTSNSGDGSEQTDGLDVIGQAPVSVYSQQIDDLAPGDTLEAISEVQVETTDHRAAVHSTFVLAGSPSDTSGTPLQADNLTEVNPYMGKLPIHDSTSWTVPGGISGSRFLNLVMRGEHLQTLGTAPDDEIAIAPDAGRLLVQHLRPVDNDPPDTSMTAGPAGLTGDPTHEFAFTSSEQNSSFQCRLDSSAEAGFLPCDSPHATASLADGPHGFEVRARDRAGNLDPTPVGRVFTVDTTPPQTTIVSGRSGKTRKRTASFGFSANEAGARFLCSLDGAGFAPCGSPQRFARLKRGAHVFRVKALDAVGNGDPSPAHRSWKVTRKPKRKG